MKTSRTWSHAEILDRSRECPDYLALCGDKALGQLFCPWRGTVAPDLAGIILGEGLVRWWLYGERCPPELTNLARKHATPATYRAFQELAIPLRGGVVRAKGAADLEEYRPRHPCDQAAWRHLGRRIKGYLECDGIIPVTCGRQTDEAVALPFKVEKPSIADGLSICDLAGERIRNWERNARALAAVTGTRNLGVRLLVDLGRYVAELDGGSFALPMALAIQRRRGVLTITDSLGILATGALKNGRLQSVSGLDAKFDLGRRLGARLLTGLGSTKGHGILPLHDGEPIAAVFEQIRHALKAHGLQSIDVPTAISLLGKLKDDIHDGMVNFDETALPRIALCEQACRADPKHPMAQEGLISAWLLRGSIANHSGNPELGHRLTNKAARAALKNRNPELYVKASASHVVSLNDMGLLNDAEAAGRGLLNWVARKFMGSAEERLRCQMIAHGVLGGQPLFQKSLCQPELAAESHALMTRALELARQLSNAKEICRDASQLALWTAMHEPANMGQIFKATDQEIRKYPREIHGISRGYLLRSRLLAAFRRALYGDGVVTAGFERWELPGQDIGEYSWVLGVSLKYRGALFARSGAMKAAAEDFDESFRILSSAKSPLFVFMAATTALLAGELLLEHDTACARGKLEAAIAIFEQYQSGAGPVDPRPWLWRAQFFLKGRVPAARSNPQRYFLY